MFTLCIQLAAPSLIGILLTDMFLGIANRMAPQVQIVFLGIPLKSWVGLAILAAAWSLILSVMSKHAMEAYSDSLAREMGKFAVKVSVVEPGNYTSAIGTTLKKRMDAQGIDLEDSLYQEEMQAIVDRVGDRSQHREPDEVAEAVYPALFDPSPKMRYMVVPNQNEAEWTIRKAIQELVELNQDHAFSYDRDALIEMLDEALAAITYHGGGCGENSFNGWR